MFAQALYSELAPFIEFMEYPPHWHSTAEVEDDLVRGDRYGVWTCWLRQGDRVFLTNTVTGRGLEATMPTLAPLDMDGTRPPGGVADLPRGLAGGQEAGLVWRSHEDGVGNYWTGGRPTVQWTRPGATPVATSGEHHHH